MSDAGDGHDHDHHDESDHNGQHDATHDGQHDATHTTTTTTTTTTPIRFGRDRGRHGIVRASLDEDPLRRPRRRRRVEDADHETVVRELIPDEYDSVQGTVDRLARRKDTDAVVTTGGTGG